MPKYKLLIEDSIKNIDKKEYQKIWQADPHRNLFTSWDYLTILEESNCIGQETGWLTNFFILRENEKEIKGVAPCFLKYHSYGEYVFDWAWAEAFHRSGVRYYPKILIASPFTPIEGARLLGLCNSREVDVFRREIEYWCRENSISSAHILFCHRKEFSVLEKRNWLTRKTIQFHWKNIDYDSFDDFLSSLQQKKRKKIKSERKKLLEKKLVCKVLHGDQIEKEHIEFFFSCYRRTYADHFSTPYLNKQFFMLLHDKLKHNLVLSVAYAFDGRPVASSMAILENINGEQTLFGRYWGSLEEIPFLHFEVAYYSLIEWSITKQVKYFEGGAQGEHKLARGFEPVVTTSLHWISNQQYHDAIKASVDDENLLMGKYIEALKARSAYMDKPNQVST